MKSLLTKVLTLVFAALLISSAYANQRYIADVAYLSEALPLISDYVVAECPAGIANSEYAVCGLTAETRSQFWEAGFIALNSIGALNQSHLTTDWEETDALNSDGQVVGRLSSRFIIWPETAGEHRARTHPYMAFHREIGNGLAVAVWMIVVD